VELRCPNKLHGVLTDDGYLEVKCRSRACGAAPGEVVVYHRFDPLTGDLQGTHRYRDPMKEGTSNDAANTAAVRSA
jgi:hypothetical protein